MTMSQKPYIIELTSVHNRRPKYLASIRIVKERVLGEDCRSRITRTDLKQSARGFSTFEEAQKFRDEHAPMFMLHWKVVNRESEIQQ